MLLGCFKNADSVGLGLGLRFWSSCKCPVMPLLLCQGPHLKEWGYKVHQDYLGELGGTKTLRSHLRDLIQQVWALGSRCSEFTLRNSLLWASLPRSDREIDHLQMGIDSDIYFLFQHSKFLCVYCSMESVAHPRSASWKWKKFSTGKGSRCQNRITQCSLSQAVGLELPWSSWNTISRSRSTSGVHSVPHVTSYLPGPLCCYQPTPNTTSSS